MDKLEKFITDNREKFEVYEPSPDLWDKINPGKQREYRIMFAWLWKAAVVLIVFGVSYWADGYIRTNQNIAGKKQDIVIPELLEAEKYYAGLIESKMNEVQPVLASFPELKKDLNSEITELDSIYKDLKNDLKDDVSNEEVIAAMIQNYRLKLQLLEQVQQELQSQKTNNKKRSYEL